MPDTDLLRQFYGTLDGRYDLTKPWTWEKWRYATDGSICVREPSTDPDHGPATFLPCMDSVRDFFKNHASKKYVGKKYLRKLEDVKLDKTKVSVSGMKECSTCKGAGEIRDSRTSCKKQCSSCQGKGDVPLYRCEIAIAQFDVDYLRLILTLPDVYYSIKLSNEQLLFCDSAGREGVLCSLHEGDE